MADIYLHHRKDKRLYASVYRLETVIFSFLSLGSLSNGDGDGDANEDGSKAIGLGWQNINLHVHHAFLCISLPSVHVYDV